MWQQWQIGTSERGSEYPVHRSQGFPQLTFPTFVTILTLLLNYYEVKPWCWAEHLYIYLAPVTLLLINTIWYQTSSQLYVVGWRQIIFLINITFTQDIWFQNSVILFKTYEDSLQAVAEGPFAGRWKDFAGGSYERPRLCESCSICAVDVTNVCVCIRAGK